MTQLKKLKLTPYRIALLLSVFSFVLPSFLSPLTGYSYEMLTYLYKEPLHHYYLLAQIVFIVLIFVKPIKKYPFLFFILPIIIVVFYYLSTLSFIFSSDYQMFEYKDREYIANLGAMSPSRAQWIEIFEFDGKHKSKNKIINGWTKNGFDPENPFKLNSLTCYTNTKNSDEIVNCSYYGISPEDMVED